MGGGQSLEQGASLHLVHPNTVEVRDRSEGPPSALPISLFCEDDFV